MDKNKKLEKLFLVLPINYQFIKPSEKNGELGKLVKGIPFKKKSYQQGGYVMLFPCQKPISKILNDSSDA